MIELRYKPEGLRNARKAANVSQADTARGTGISQATLSSCENGRVVPTLMNAITLALYYGIGFDELVSEIVEIVDDSEAS